MDCQAWLIQNKQFAQTLIQAYKCTNSTCSQTDITVRVGGLKICNNTVLYEKHKICNLLQLITRCHPSDRTSAYKMSNLLQLIYIHHSLMGKIMSLIGKDNIKVTRIYLHISCCFMTLNLLCSAAFRSTVFIVFQVAILFLDNSDRVQIFFV